MTPLRQRMIRAMELHRLTQATKDAYLQAIVQLAKFHSRSPASQAVPAPPRLELADILRQHGRNFLKQHPMPHYHRKVIHRIIACRTAALGGHVRWCDQCGFEAYVYHSCRDRHCPKCQTHAKEQWRQARAPRTIHADSSLRLFGESVSA